MKNNLFEEIDRFKLLSNYNSKKTLTENLNEVEIGEARRAPTLTRNIERQSADALKTTAKDAGKFFNRFKMKSGFFASSDAFYKFLTNSAEEMEKAFKKSLKTGDELADKLSQAQDISKAIAARRVLDAEEKLGRSLKKAELDNILLQTKRETEAIAADVKIKKQTPKTDGGGKKKTENPTDDLDKVEGGNQTKVNINNTTIINKIYKLIKDPELIKKIRQGTWTWKEILPYILTGLAGGALGSLLTWLFMRKGKEYFPDCISGKVMAYPSGIEQAAKAGKELPMNVYLNDPSNPQVMGALFTSQGKGATSGSIALPNGTSGTWTMEGDNVKIDAGGNVIYMDCSTKVVINTEPTPEPAPAPAPGPTPGGCTPSSDFPFTYYQMNSMVGSVQNCVGATADNCMGPQTARKIQQFLGLTETPTSLTKDIYDKVMAKCKGSTSTKQEPIKEPTQTSGSVTGGGEKPSSEEDFEF